MNPQMTDLRAVNAIRAHRDQSAPEAAGHEHNTSRFGEQLLRIRPANLIVSIRMRWQRQAQSDRKPPTPRAALASLVPTAVFLIVHSWAGLVAAIIAASVASTVVIVLRRRRGETVGVLLPATLALVFVRGVVGVLTESGTVYLGIGIAVGAVIALLIGATAFTGTPAASYFIPLFKRYRYLTPDHPLYRRISAQLTVAWVLMELAISGWEAWYLTQVTATEFVVLRHLIGWPIMAAWIFLLVFYLRFRLDPLDYVLGRRSSSLGRTDPLRYGDSVGHRA